MSFSNSAALFVAFTMVCAALFAFVWRVQFIAQLHAAERALQQNTMIAASAGKLRIETSGPFGSASYDLRAADGHSGIDGLGKGRTHRQSPAVDCLKIMMRDGTSIHILPGRDEAELRWVAQAVGSALLGK
jgi:hypothetical protein